MSRSVQSHWDRQGKKNEHSSCWMRVMQAWAGTGWGFQFVPRIGMEVVVSFLGGDLDRPVVMGCLYNAIQGPSFLLPGAKSRSGFRTHTTPGGAGYNELSFEDRQGGEEVYLRAQRDLKQEVGNDVTTTVLGRRREAIRDSSSSEVAGFREEDTGGDRRERVGGRTISNMEQDRIVNVGGDQTTRVEGNESLRVAGDRHVEIEGASTIRVAGGASRDVNGDCKTFIHGAASHVVSKNAMVVLDQCASVSVREAFAFAVGSVDRKASAAFQVNGDARTLIDGDAEIVVEKAIRIRAGSNVITISPDEIRIEAGSLVLAAKSISAAGEKSSLDVGEKVEIRGKTVKISSADDAIIELTKDAKIDGAPALKLNSKNAAEEKAREEKAPEIAAAQKVKVKLYDRAGEPVTGAPYEVTFPGYIDRGTASDGVVEVPKIEGADRCLIRWARPAASRPAPVNPTVKAPEFEFEMEVYLSFDDAEETENIRRKLHNLGHGDPRGLDHAVAAFQMASGSQVVSGLAEDVKADVEDRHDSQNPIKMKTEVSA